MKENQIITKLTLALILLLVVVPPTIAQEPTPTPPTWQPPQIHKYGDPCGDVHDRVRFNIVVTNPGDPNAAPWPDATWYNVRVTDRIDPALRIDSVTTTRGTVTITGNTIVVNGGITLGPGESFQIDIVTTVLDYPSNQVIYNEAELEYTDPDDNPWGPIRTGERVRIVPCTPPVIPEASTLILLGSAASGLAGYVGLQLRARRRNRS